MPTQTAESRRTVHYSSLEELQADVERLVTEGHRTVGNWSLGQILAHLQTAFQGSLDGYGFQAPWFVRTLIGPLMKRRIRHKPLPSGFKLPKTASSLIPKENVTTEEGLRLLKDVLERLKTETPEAPHPALGTMSPEDWDLLHRRHAELHMSFVVPQEP